MDFDTTKAMFKDRFNKCILFHTNAPSSIRTPHFQASFQVLMYGILYKEQYAEIMLTLCCVMGKE